MKTPALLFGLLLSGAAGATNAPADGAMYIRGGFNGWGTDHPLSASGKHLYETRILLSPGYHPFKVGSSDWSAEWVIDADKSVRIAPGKGYTLEKNAGAEDYLFVKTSAPYLFQLDLAQPERPVLRVQRLEAPSQVAADPHRGHAGVVSLPFPTFDGKRETVRFSSPDAAAPLRSYVQSTTIALRDPGPQHANYAESAELPVVRSGNLAFDALFALAGAEMRQNAVASIKDGNYNGGAAIDCQCFETGEKWHYVWTRDLSYAADLGLALLDPQRVRNSLEFKLSPLRTGIPRAAQMAGTADALQIIQDTGSGGSWPVSTDRITWAFGAEKALHTLPAQERAAFAQRALTALANTIDNDRVAAFDAASGLYAGEQSFLDWRDQSYAAWIVNDLASMASSRALSTNVGHYKALTLAASLAREQDKAAQAERYAAWAAQLKEAINRAFWLPEAGMYSSLSAAHFNGAPMHKFDWLGQSLAIITGVADPARTQSILARYPHGPLGAPVIYPQQQDQPVYHNRAMWPFVTAYGLKAAVVGRNVSVADSAYQTLMRGAALNLSNMENLEWLSGQALLLDERNPSLIGPVINSRRQLWSVGGYLGMVIENVFGLSASASGIRIDPFITARLRREMFGQSASIALNGVRLHGKRLSVRVQLPPAASGNGYYEVQSLTLDGKPVAAGIGWDQLAADSVVAVRLGRLLPGVQEMRRVSADPYAESPAVFAPRETAISKAALQADGSVAVSFEASRGKEKTRYHLYRNGKLAASDVAPGTWIDRTPGNAPCYAVEAQFARSGNRSHHSPAVCAGQAIEIAATDSRVLSNVAVAQPGPRFNRPHLKDWGRPEDSFAIDAIDITEAGQYQLQVRYHNSANQINLGISGGVKWLVLSDAAGKVVAQGVIQLPHARLEKKDTPLVLSTPLAAQLAPGRYRLQLSDFYNMSYLQSNNTFSAAGGLSGPSNRFDLYGVRLLRTSF